MSTSLEATSPPQRDSRGTWWQRFLIALFSLALALLCYWLIGFVLQDIGQLQGPDWAALQAEKLDPKFQATRERLTTELAEIGRQVENEQRRQQLLRDSTATSQKTLGQLLELQRMSLEQKSALPPEQQAAFAESQRLFLANQTKDQELNESLAELLDRQARLKEEERLNLEELSKASAPLQQEFAELDRRHRWHVAAIKIAFLAPLLIVAGLLFGRYRNSPYAPMIYAFGGAVLAKAFVVMHEYFPRECFRYVLILSALGVIGALLAKLLRMVAHPGRAARLKLYREAYEAFLCPVCRYPIRRGPLRYMAWTLKSLQRVSQPLETASDEPYTCPSCATPLYDKCPKCSATRHTLLPACEHCGFEEPPE